MDSRRSKMYISTPPGILKTATILVGLLATILGCTAYFKSSEAPMNNLLLGQWMYYDQFFVGASIFFFLGSVVSLVAGMFLTDMTKNAKFFDVFYQFLGAVFVLVAAVLIIASAVSVAAVQQHCNATSCNTTSPAVPTVATLKFKHLDLYHKKQNVTIKDFNATFDHGLRIGAGTMGICNSLIYLALTAVILVSIRDPVNISRKA